MKTIIELDNGEVICIYKEKGKYRIQCENLFPIVVLTNVGIPGIIGPTLEYDIGEIYTKDCEAAEYESNLIEQKI